MKNKRLIMIMMVVCLLCSLLAVTTSAATVKRGTCGENLVWELTNDGVLTISGTGPMTNFAASHQVPWYKYQDSIRTLILKPGVTSIGDLAFVYCEWMTLAILPDSIAYIGEEAFCFCMSLRELIFWGNIPALGQDAFYCVESTVYYPRNDTTWTADKMQSWGDEFVWMPYAEGFCAPAVESINIGETGKIRLSWNVVDEAVQYSVYRATSKTGSYQKLATSFCTVYTDTSASAGKTYYYYVEAVDVNGNQSVPSNQISRTCDLPRPEISISNVAKSGKIKVSWNPIKGAKAYVVYRATSQTGTYKKMKTTNNTYYVNTSAEAGKTYYYKVVAVHTNANANSAESAEKRRTCDLPRPNVSVTLKNKKPRLSWNKIDGAVRYEIYRATTKGNTYLLIGETQSRNFRDTSAKAGKTYYYTVVAIHEKTAAKSALSLIDAIKSR